MPIPHSLSELNIAAGEIPAMAAESLDQTRLLQNNPREWSEQAAREILEIVK
jgi:alcohol dehydrogenase class IV